jgi:hypothetical protein
MPAYEDTFLRCNDCGVEIPVVAVAGPEGTVALTVEDYLSRQTSQNRSYPAR